MAQHHVVVHLDGPNPEVDRIGDDMKTMIKKECFHTHSMKFLSLLQIRAKLTTKEAP